jgi:hypothetical protein
MIHACTGVDDHTATDLAASIEHAQRHHHRACSDAAGGADHAGGVNQRRRRSGGIGLLEGVVEALAAGVVAYGDHEGPIIATGQLLTHRPAQECGGMPGGVDERLIAIAEHNGQIAHNLGVTAAANNKEWATCGADHGI